MFTDLYVELIFQVYGLGTERDLDAFFADGLFVSVGILWVMVAGMSIG